jgi:hypothetical protein
MQTSPVGTEMLPMRGSDDSEIVVLSEKINFYEKLNSGTRNGERPRG